MGTNLQTIKARIWQTLRDELSESKAHEFKTDELDGAIARANVKVSEASPRERKVTVATISGSKEVDLSDYTDDLIEIIKAEYPVDQDPPKYRNVEIFSGIARLVIDSNPSGANAYFFLHTLHELTLSSSTMNNLEEDALVVGAAAYAAESWLNIIRTELKEAFVLLDTVQTTVATATARIAQATTDLNTARGKVDSVTIANAVRDLIQTAGGEIGTGQAYMNQGISYLRQMTSQLSEPRAITAYHSKVAQQLAQFEERLRVITKARNQQEYSRA